MEEASRKKSVKIDIVSDIICPWCYIGKRKLEAAIDSCKDDYEFTVIWHPYLLRPNMPVEGVPKPAFYNPNSPVAKRIIDAGASVGIDFTFKSTHVPYSVFGHCALEFATHQDPTGKVQNDLQEKLFKSYFVQGTDLSLDCVTSLSIESGLNGDQVREYLSDEKNLRAVKEKAASWSQRGVSGVPFFIMNGIKTFSGAQDIVTFQQMFKRISEKFPNPQHL